MGKRAVLPAWCKEAKIAMIKKDLDVGDLVKMTGKTRTWISGVINGRNYSPDTVKEISDILGITDSGNFL